MSRPVSSHFSQPPLTPARKPLICFLSLALLVPNSPQARITRYVVFLPLLHAAQCVHGSSVVQGMSAGHPALWPNNTCVYRTWMHPLVCICSLFNGHLNCFVFSTMTNNAAKHIYVQVYVWLYGINFSWARTEAYSNSTFNIWMNCQTTFPTLHQFTCSPAF